jgi:hypothetical protein
MLAARLAVQLSAAAKPEAYSWRQLWGAGTLAGIGFTMALFIAGAAFPDLADYAAAKIAIFLASLAAGALGVLILWPTSERSTSARHNRGSVTPAGTGEAGHREAVRRRLQCLAPKTLAHRPIS